MFTPIHLLPQSASDDYGKYKERWETVEGRELHEKILSMIRQGAGEDFLESDFQNGLLGFLEDEWDLRGFKLINEEIDFPPNDNFEAIDFSFAEFYHSKFTNALFSCSMSFTKFHNCTFKNCVFILNHCYAATFQKVNFIDCDFLEHVSFTNCSFSEVLFRNTFFPSNVFQDCLFSPSTVFSSFPENPVTYNNKTLCLRNSNKSDLYRQISEAYSCGGAYSTARRYRFLHSQCSTRFNSPSLRQKVSGFFWEYLTGYGLRPLRVILVLLFYFIFVLAIFASQIGLNDALLLTCGSLFTFGAKSEILNEMNLFFHVLYIISSFIGISLTALFVTVSFNVFLSNK